jgi:hypothetical protein
MRNAGVTKHLYAYIKENYIGKLMDILNHQNFHSVIIRDKTARLQVFTVTNVKMIIFLDYSAV